MKEEFRILSPTAILGYGFPAASFEEGMRRRPHLIAVDAGSSDPGPYYLGAGVSFTDRGAVGRDLSILLAAAVEHGIPVVIGTAGGSGANAHLEWCLDIVREIARAQNLHFPAAAIRAEIPREAVLAALRAGRVSPLGPAPELTEAALADTARVVGQMGLEPIQRALAGGVQVVVAGRAYDPSVFAALPVLEGYDRGLAIHLGKILECAAIAATPGSGSDCMLGTLGEDYFRVEPLAPERRCTTLSVAAHTLYEKSNPYLLPGPGGVLSLEGASFEQETERAVRVKGSRFLPGAYRIKLEGARKIGCRTVSIAGARDPVMLQKIDEVLRGVRTRVEDNFAGSDFSYRLDFKVYGRDGVMGALEPNPAVEGHEVGIVIDALADTQAHADTICAFARSTMLHYGYEGRRATAGNLAFPYSPSDFHAGDVYSFSVYHLMDVEDPCGLFPIETFAL